MKTETDEAGFWIPRRLARLIYKLEELGADAALLASIPSLRYFAGYQTPIEWGPSPFAPCPALLLWTRGAKVELLLAEGEVFDPVPSDIILTRIPGYSFTERVGHNEELVRIVLQRVSGCRNLAVEANHTPSAVLLAVLHANPLAALLDASLELAAMRVVKDPAEIEILREAVRLTDVGQAAAMGAATVGMREIELFGEIHKAIEREAGQRVPILADIVTGPRTAEAGGQPGERKMQHGDLVIVDLVPRWRGLWGDSCNTFALGSADAEQQRIWDGIANVLDDLIAQVRPGAEPRDLDAFSRARIADLGGGYEHHTGHGLGASWHEEPRIVAYNSKPLEAGMVIALEPGIYFAERYGIRLESVILVTDSGAELLTQFWHRLTR